MDLPNCISSEILDSIGEGIYTIDKKFKISFMNKAAEEILGVKREKVIGKFCKHVFSSEECLDKCPISKVLDSGKNVYDHITKFYHQNGISKNVRVNASLLHNSDNEIIGGVVSFRDLSNDESSVLKSKTMQDFYGIVGQSKPMLELYDLVTEIGGTCASVLIQGESGTGKEMFANAIQASSQRNKMPFIKVNCSVFPPQLLASELFGHVKGAFTDAIQNRKGRFEIADKGTLFLDEVAEMPLSMQLQLLRVLHEGTFERVGESLTRSVDVRVIAATNKELDTAINDGSFREDLFYRLNVIPMHIPALRERRADIPHLVNYFVEKFSSNYHKEIQEVDDEAMDYLTAYNWPGNVRELENAIEYSFIRTHNDDVITAKKLPANIRQKNGKFFTTGDNKFSERDEILETLKKHHWNKSKAADELRMGRTTLWRKMKSMGIET